MTSTIPYRDLMAAVEALGVDANAVLSLTADRFGMTVRYVPDIPCNPDNPQVTAVHRYIDLAVGQLAAAGSAMRLPNPESIERLNLYADFVHVQYADAETFYRVGA